MGTLQTELVRLKLTKKSKRLKRVQDAKAWQAEHDWSKVEAELLASQAQTEEVK